MTEDRQMNRQKTHRDHVVTGFKFPLVLVALDLHSPENLGSLLRIADALGVEKVLLTGESVLPSHAKVAKTARSTHKCVKVEIAESALSELAKLRDQGYKIVCLELSAQSLVLADFNLARDDKIALVLGAEREGVATDILNFADVSVEIPMLGENSSMNIAAACAIAVYDITQKMRHSGA